MPITLDRYLYLDADKKKVVEENDPAARFVLGGPGSVIGDEDAKLYGLEEFLKKGLGSKGSGAKSQAPGSPPRGDPKPETPDPSQKATEPEANKAKEPAKNKGK